jgi:hypothetical protein
MVGYPIAGAGFSEGAHYSYRGRKAADAVPMRACGSSHRYTFWLIAENPVLLDSVYLTRWVQPAYWSARMHLF